MARSIKKPKNLSLDPRVVARGERYSELHGTNLSRLVGDFLRALPVGEPEPASSPIVRRLRGVAASGKGSRDTYRQHLRRKYGGR
ncbi:MAG TPA: DUF6364 family protein [Gemmatimonadaceae bacterium]